MPVIQLLPEVDCTGCVWLPISVMEMNRRQIDGVFGKLIFLHESAEAQILVNRDINCPIHGARGYR